jgi:hypothetical protein
VCPTKGHRTAVPVQSLVEVPVPVPIPRRLLRCLSVPCCLRSLPLVQLTSLPLASAAARGQWRASGAAAVGTAGPLPFVCESLSNCLLLAAALTSMEQGPMACARCL